MTDTVTDTVTETLTDTVTDAVSETRDDTADAVADSRTGQWREAMPLDELWEGEMEGVEVDGAFEALLCVLDVAGLLFGEGQLEERAHVVRRVL